MLYKTGKKALFAHLDRVRSLVTLKSKNDKENAALLEAELIELSERHSTLSRFRLIVFILLYASVASTISIGFPVLTEIAKTIAYLGSIAGAGILSILALYLTWRMNMLWQHMLVTYSHVIVIYEKNNKGLLQKE
jgi:hypothetical protein